MTTLYRIHVEAVSMARIAALTSESFEAFTLSESTGYWHGNAERSATIEVYGTALDQSRINNLAEQLRSTFNQQAVLVSALSVNASLVVSAPAALAA